MKRDRRHRLLSQFPLSFDDDLELIDGVEVRIDAAWACDKVSLRTSFALTRLAHVVPDAATVDQARPCFVGRHRLHTSSHPFPQSHEAELIARAGQHLP